MLVKGRKLNEGGARKILPVSNLDELVGVEKDRGDGPQRKVVVPTCGLRFSVTASRIFVTLNVTAHLKPLFGYREKFIAHPAATLRTTQR